MKVYISIPITGLDHDEQKRKALMIAESYRAMGSKTVTPFDIISSENPQKEDYAYCMGQDVEAMLRCDTVCFANGWQYSKGCMAEFAIAKVYGKIIEFEI